MNTLRDILSRVLAVEPAVVISVLSGLALIGANFGLPAAGINFEPIVMAVFNLLAVIGTILGVRGSVFSPATHTAELTAAYEAGLRDAQPD